MENYKLYLYKPSGDSEDFLGELLVDNLQVNIKLHEISSISFTIPEVVNGAANIRLDEVLDGYIVELWYGRVDGIENTDYFKIRFVLHTTPLDYNDFKRTYSYEGFSFESMLEFKQINNWPGVEIKDFYREPKYDNSTTDQYTEVAATGQTIPNHPYAVTAKTVGAGNYIRIAPTTPTATSLDIYVYEVREDTLTNAYNEIAYIRYSGVTYNESGFKQGYYFLDMDEDNKYVEYIYIYVPDNYEDFNNQPSNKKLSFKVYDNPISRHYAVGVNRNDENPYSNMYIDLAQDVEDGDPAEYGNYSFITQPTYSKNGLKLEHVLLGNIESSSLTSDGLLYNTDFTIGIIHEDIAAKYRSNLEYNNISVYQAIRDLAESFDAIPVFDTILKTVSFYPENADTWPNNGLILKYGTYLKNIKKDIDASKIVTAARGIGKDNLNTIALITPDGSDSWQDFSYYLDEFYIDSELSLSQLNDAGFVFTLQNPSSGVYYLGISYPNSDNTSSYQSRWMSAAEAKKVAKWQFNRDFMHKVLLGEIKPSEVDYSGLNLSPLDRYYDLYNIRSENINDYVQSDTTLSKMKAQSYRYKYLYDYYDKKVKVQEPFNPDSEDSKKFLYYKDLWEQAQAIVAAQEIIVENKRLAIFTDTINDSVGDKLGEIRTGLNKITTFSINMNKLEPFIKEFIVNDTKLDNDLDLLDAVVTHVNENKIPKITIDVGIVDILGAQESYEDWNKLKVGDLVSVYYPEFNIDQEVQIRELSIDFESHTASMVISSVRNYNKGYGNYISKIVKKLNITEKNIVSNLQDSNRVSSEESNDAYSTLNGGELNTSDANIIFGSTDSNGNTSTSLTGSGFESLTVDEVDPLIEVFSFGSDKSVTISEGAILAKYSKDDFKTEVEISADKGIEIRKITGSAEDEDLLVTKQVYIDTNGNAVFAGSIQIGSSAYDQIVSLAGAGTTVFKAGSIEEFNDITTQNVNDLLLITETFTDTEAEPEEVVYIKDDIYRYDLITAPDTYSWVLAADLKTKRTGTVAGWKIDGTTISSNSDNVVLNNAGWIGLKKDSYDDSTAGAFLGIDTEDDDIAKLNVGDESRYLKWTGEELEVVGDIGGSIGSIVVGNVTINNNGITGTDNSENTTFFLDADNGDVFIKGTLSVGQTISGFNQQGVFVGKELDTSKFSLVSGSTFLTFDPSRTDYKLIISGDAKLGPLTVGSGSTASTFIGFTSNTGPITYFKRSTTTTLNSNIIGPQTTTNIAIGMSLFGNGIQSNTTITAISPSITISNVATTSATSLLTYARQSADYYFNLSDIQYISIESSGFSAYNATPAYSNRQITIEVYNNTTLLQTSGILNLPNTNYPFHSNITLYELTSPLSANRIKIITSATTSTTDGTWNVTPSVAILSGSLNLGNFSANSSGVLKAESSTFGNLSGNHAINISPRTIVSGTRKVTTIQPANNMTTDTTVTLPRYNGTMLLSTNGNDHSTKTYVNGFDNDIFMVATSSSNSKINIVAADTIRLTTTQNSSGDIELTALDNIQLRTGTDGVRFYGTNDSAVANNYTAIKRANNTVINSINFPLINGTFELSRVELTAATVAQNENTGYRDAIGNWMFVELFRGSAKVYEVNIYVPSVSTSANTTLYPYVWREPTSGLFGDTMTIQRSGTSIQIKTNAGGDTTFKFWRYGNPAS
jgi:hypothetical protein